MITQSRYTVHVKPSLASNLIPSKTCVICSLLAASINSSLMAASFSSVLGVILIESQSTYQYSFKNCINENEILVEKSVDIQLNWIPGPVGEVEECGHDLGRNVVDLDDVVVMVPLEELGLDA